MVPDPTVPFVPSQTIPTEEDAIVQAINAGKATGWTNDEVPSLNSIATWSNTMSKTYTIEGTATNSPIGTTGIGAWYDGDPADIDPTTDEADWMEIPILEGISNNDDIKVDILFDPHKSAPVVLGGYIIDDVTSKMCVRFAAELSEEDTHTAKIGIEFTIKRTETVPIS